MKDLTSNPSSTQPHAPHRRSIGLAMTICLTLGLMLMVGCATDEQGVSTTAINSQQMTAAKAVPQVADAAVRAFKHLQLHDIQRRNNRKQAEIRGYTASNTPVRLYARRIKKDKTNIQIRVGTLGDKDLGVTVLRKVKGQLRRGPSNGRAGH